MDISEPCTRRVHAPGMGAPGAVARRIAPVRRTRPEVLLVMKACHEECESILLGISRYQSEHGAAWNVFIDDRGRADDDPEWVSSHPWSGVISRTTTRGMVEVCAARRLPLVDLNDGPVFSGVPKIRPDNRAIGHMGAEHLHERGYRHLYFCGYSDQRWSLERRDGFLEALLLLGCPGREYALPSCSITPAKNAEIIVAMAEWLRSLPKLAGIMAAHDQQAAQLLMAAECAGIKVPEDVAVLGVNNDRVRCGLAVPPLSSVATDAVRTGYLAAEELARRMQGELGAFPEVLVEPVKVVTRRSTDNLAVDDHAISRALGIIREKACERISVADVMRMASISRARLENGFRRYVGRSPQAEIRRIQLARIKQLLIETDLPLKQIALMTGYEHVEYLNVSFKRAVGETPGRFRRNARGVAARGSVASAA